jgi:hypothetical protein
MSKLGKDSKGIAHVLLILLVAGVVGVGGFAVWRISSYNDKSDQSGVETTDLKGEKANSADVSAECVAKTGDTNICRMGAIPALGKYNTVQTLKIGGQTYTIRSDDKGNIETIIPGLSRSVETNGKYYINMDGVWYYNDKEQAADVPMPDLGFATTAGIKYDNRGKVKCDSGTCLDYKMTGGILGDGVVTALINDKDYIPRQIVSKGGLLGNLTLDIQVLDKVTINVPTGAKPISSMFGGVQP